MWTFFWERKGTLLANILPKGATIISEHDCSTVKSVRWAIQWKRRGIIVVAYLHDNARPHKSYVIKISCTLFTERCLNIHPIIQISFPGTFCCPFARRNFCPVITFHRLKHEYLCDTLFRCPGGRLLWHWSIKHIQRYDKCYNTRDSYAEN